MGRAPCCDKANVKKGPWSPEEDAKLKAYIDKHGTGNNWIALPQKVGLKRCGKSCRLRWLNYLRPNIKHGGFTEEEDNTILNLYISIGSRWSIIAAQLPGRTDNDIKNYWNTKLKKKLLGRRKQPKLCNEGEESSKDMGNGSSYTPTLSNSALERLQLHMQLQGIQTPISLYNNPTLWPKLHPLQEKMIRNLQSSSEKNTTNANLIEQLVSLNPICYPDQKQDETRVGFYEQMDIKTDNLQVDEMENSFNGSISSDSSMAFNPSVEIQKAPAFGSGELNDLLGNGAKEFDCFKSMDVPKEVMGMMNWWPTEQFNLPSWDSSASSSLPSSSEVVIHDYSIGY
ncbi:hypothetical protein V2J09_018839 [Rumex salicifolius]